MSSNNSAKPLLAGQSSSDSVKTPQKQKALSEKSSPSDKVTEEIREGFRSLNQNIKKQFESFINVQKDNTKATENLTKAVKDLLAANHPAYQAVPDEDN